MDVFAEEMILQPESEAPEPSEAPEARPERPHHQSQSGGGRQKELRINPKPQPQSLPS